MEVYNEVENNANNVGNTYLRNITEKCKHHELGHNMQMINHIKEEENANRTNLINIRVFKLTIRNATKRLKMQQKMCKPTKNTKTTKATLKQIANQEFPTKKRIVEI